MRSGAHSTRPSARACTPPIFCPSLLDMDEGRWREARHGQPITAYYLRDSLGGHAALQRRERSRRAAGVKAPRISSTVMTFCTSRTPSSAISAKDCPAVRDADKGSERTRTDARKMIQKHPPHPSHPPHWLESEDNSNTYAETDVRRMPEADPACRNHESADLLAKGGQIADPPQASASASASEKPEEMQATPADETDETDETDIGEGPCASSAPEPSKPKGAAGRKKRKT